MNRIKETRYHF